MKQFFTLALVLSLSFSFAQNSEATKSSTSISEDNYKKVHELRLGAIKLIAAGFIDISYEYINTSSTGMGASLIVNLDESIESEKFGVIPYYRFYFGNNEEYQGHGFFVEGFTYLYTGENTIYNYYFNSQGNYIEEEVSSSFFDIAPGFAVGSKWINSSGFLFQVKLGIGRNLIGNNFNEFVATGDFYIGYRF